MKVAIVHDWLVNYGGAERVVEQMMALYPDADIYTLVYDKKKDGKTFPTGKSPYIICPAFTYGNKALHQTPEHDAQSF